MRREIKKLIAATMSMAMLIGAGNTVMSSASGAGAPRKSFSFKIKADYKPSISVDNYLENYVYRSTADSNNAWMVDFRNSNETKTGHTTTMFYIGVVTPKGQNNKYGSAVHSVVLGSGQKYFSAYSIANKNKIVLYGKDNKDGTTGSYTVSGYWSPQTGKFPVDDRD